MESRGHGHDGTPARLSVVAGGGDGPAAAPAPPRVVLPPDWLPIVLFAGDAAIAGASALTGYWLRTLPYTDPAARLQQAGPYVHAIPVVMAVCALALAVNRQYRSWRGGGMTDRLVRLHSGIGLATLALLSLLALTHTTETFSRYSILYAAVLAAVAMTVERLVLREVETRLRRAGIGTERVLMVGAGGTAELLIGRMGMFPQLGYTVCGVVDDRLGVGSSFAGLPVLGRPKDLPRLVEEHQVDKCILAMPSGRRGRLVELVRQCQDQRIAFRLVPDLLELTSTRASAESVDGLPLIGLRDQRIGSLSWAGKRLIDVAVAWWALLLAAPLLLGVAAAIRLTSPGGPAIVRHQRIGRFRRTFTVYRFRTTGSGAAGGGRVVALREDATTTALGALLRRTGLDELPQLFNVLRGDMSLVGPRPLPLYVDERYGSEVPRYLERQQVRPGLIGWAEANDLRDASPIGDRTMYDIYYIENWSLAMDLRILALAALRFMRYRQAN